MPGQSEDRGGGVGQLTAGGVVAGGRGLQLAPPVYVSRSGFQPLVDVLDCVGDLAAEVGDLVFGVDRVVDRGGQQLRERLIGPLARSCNSWMVSRIFIEAR